VGDEGDDRVQEAVERGPKRRVAVPVREVEDEPYREDMRRRLRAYAAIDQSEERTAAKRCRR
jgi:hypothetical protein